MKLLILSDLHLEFGTFLVPKVDYDVVILAGDISVPGSKAMRWARRSENFGETVGFHRSLTLDFHRILTHPLCEPEGFTVWISA